MLGKSSLGGEEMGIELKMCGFKRNRDRSDVVVAKYKRDGGVRCVLVELSNGWKDGHQRFQCPWGLTGLTVVSERIDGRILNLCVRNTQHNSFYFITSWPFPII